jgi:uncharacterized protein YjbI with pentapeptide repeats
MTSQHRLLLAALVTLLLGLCHWWFAAAFTALLLVAQAAMLLGSDWFAARYQGLQQLRLPRWLLVAVLVIGLLAFLVFAGAGLKWRVPLVQLVLSQQALISDLSQIAIALLALVVTLRQFSVERVIIKELNLITQAQLVDNFIQGISEMISDGDGFLEDWPLERMLTEGRLSALFGSVDGTARARVLRFLSHANLLTPLKRDHRVGRPILDGEGTYVVDRLSGIPVVMLRQVLVGADLSRTDLTGVDFNGADLSGADLRWANLREANLSGVNLTGANLDGANLDGARFFYGSGAEVSPASSLEEADLQTGRASGAILTRTRLSGAQHLSAEVRSYANRWLGSEFR